MKRVLLVLGLLAVLFFVGKGLVKEASSPTTSGTVEVVEVVEDMPVEGPMTEEESMEEEEVMEEEVVEMPVEPVFVPLKFKKLSDLKKMGGKKVDSPDSFIKQYGAKKKGYRVGGDFYFQGKDGIYVFHGGEVIKL